MATTTLTNAYAISALIDFAVSNGFAEQNALVNQAIIEKAKKHLATMVKPSKTEQNKAILDDIVPFIEQAGECSTKDILTAYPSLGSSSKVFAVLKLGLEAGIIGRKRGATPSSPDVYFII